MRRIFGFFSNVGRNSPNILGYNLENHFADNCLFASRGAIEPDSGAVFECAYAYCTRKKAISYMVAHRDLLIKLLAVGLGPPEGQFVGVDGTIVEDFGWPLNLMVAQCLYKLTKTLEEAVALVKILE